MHPVATFLGVALAAFVAELVRRIAVRQRRIGRAIDWLGETLDGPDPGKPPPRPRPLASTHADKRETHKSDPPPPPKDAA